jgi:folylpolyglutamate synthase/dihydropteroate synthase
MAPFLGPGRPTLVLAIMADKDVEGVARALAGAAYLTDARVIATAPAVERALPPEELAARWKAATGLSAETIAEPADALDAALSGGRGPGGSGGGRGLDGGPVIVAGSLYLVGVARSLLLPDPRLEPDPPPLKREGAP